MQRIYSCIHKKLQSVLNNKGTTMMELLVAFVVLMIIFAIIYSMISFTSNLRMEAVDVRNAEEEFEAELYKSVPDNNKVEVQEFELIQKDDKDIPMFVLSLNTSEGKTDLVSNIGITSIESNPNIQNNLSAVNLKGKAYISKYPNISVVPKTIKFEYKKN